MNRLFLKISIGILVALIISIVLAAITVKLGARRNIADRIQAHLGAVYSVEDGLLGVPDPAIPAELSRLKNILPGLKADVNSVHSRDDSLPESTRKVLDRDRIFVELLNEGVVVYKRINQSQSILVYGPIRAPLTVVQLHLVIAIVFILTIVVAVGYLLANPVANRLKALEGVTIRFGEGNLDTRAKITSSDSIGALALRFNQMADRIQQLIDDQRYLIRAVSHELRQPLSRLRFNLELLHKADKRDDRNRRILKTENELEELGELVSELMLYMHMDKDITAPNKGALLLHGVLAELVEKCRILRPDIDVSIKSLSGGDIHVKASETHFRRAIGNLLSNAIRAAKREVVIDYSRDDSGVVIGVTDDGDGIPEMDRERVFKPFFRLDDSRSRDLGGVGLGLAIVHRIIESHGGIVEIVDSNGKGARFNTFWPSK